MNTYPISGTKILDYSDVTYGILRVNRSEIANFLPTLYYPITVHDNAKNKDYNNHMHLSVRNRIDGFTEIYKDNKVKEGDSIIMELHKEHEDGNPKYVLNVSFQKNKKNSNEKNGKQRRDEDIESQLQQEIFAIKEVIKNQGTYFKDNEANVRAEIVERILNVIGWNFPCLAREVKAGEGNQKVDIVLYDGVQKREKCYALIETKAIDESFDKKDLHKYRKTETPYGQLTRYIKYFNKTKPVPIGMLTNGQTWIVYRYNWRAETLQEMRRIDIDSKDISKVTSFFDRLRKENIAELINELIKEVTIEDISPSEFE